MYLVSESGAFRITEIKPNQVRLGEHCDYGSITLLFQLDSEGLQVSRAIRRGLVLCAVLRVICNCKSTLCRKIKFVQQNKLEFMSTEGKFCLLQMPALSICRKGKVNGLCGAKQSLKMPVSNFTFSSTFNTMKTDRTVSVENHTQSNTELLLQFSQRIRPPTRFVLVDCMHVRF